MARSSSNGACGPCNLSLVLALRRIRHTKNSCVPCKGLMFQGERGVVCPIFILPTFPLPGSSLLPPPDRRRATRCRSPEPWP
jgi:hypothetical protein